MTDPGLPENDEEDEVIGRLVDGTPIEGEPTPTSAAYEDLIGRIRDLPDIPPPAGWEERLQMRWQEAEEKRVPKPAAKPKRRWPKVAGGLGVFLAAAAVIVVVSRPGAPERAKVRANGVALLDESGKPVRSKDPNAGNTGDDIVVGVATGRAHEEVRIYLGDKQVVRCPGDAACRVETRKARPGEATMIVQWKAAAAGVYKVVIIGGDQPIPTGTGSHTVDLQPLVRAGYSIDQTNDPQTIR